MLKDLMSRTYFAEITEGKHTAKLQSWKLFEDKNGNPDNDYIRMQFTINNCGTEQTYNRNMFERDISIMLSQIRRQLGRQDEAIQPVDFFNTLINDQTGFDMWIEWQLVTTKTGARRVQNVRFIAPVETHAPAGDMETPE